MKKIFDQVSIKCSQLTTRAYSTSFSLGIQLLDKSLRNSIHSIYGYVRFADEIVDTFHDFNKEELLERFKKDTFIAIEEGISLNPIINSFQATVNRYQIDHSLITLFLNSMAMDLEEQEFKKKNFNEYILGSAEVVGLMCLTVFCNGNKQQYEDLKPFAMSLGAAFQKVNFLRDINADYNDLGRSYFPNVDLTKFDDNVKTKIEFDIERDFEMAKIGIKRLPKSSRFGVYLAYVYYLALFNKIKNTPSFDIMKVRIRVPNNRKYSLLFFSYLRYRLNIIK